MSKTKMTFEFFVPTASVARCIDVRDGIIDYVTRNHRVESVFATITTGPFDEEEGTDSGKERSGLGRQPEGSDNGDDADAGSDEPKPVKRGRGRPRKHPEAQGKAAQERGGDESEDAEGGQAAGGTKPERTRKGAGEGAGEGEGRGGSTRGRGDDQRGNRQAARISSGEDRGEAQDEWEEAGDEKDVGELWDEAEDEPAELIAARSKGEWPDSLTPKEIDKTVIQSLLGEHFKSHGGKKKELTFDIMMEVTGARALGEVDPSDYEALAKALLKDAAKYNYGLKKPVG